MRVRRMLSAVFRRETTCHVFARATSSAAHLLFGEIRYVGHIIFVSEVNVEAD